MESEIWSLPLGALKIVGLHPTDNSRIAQIISAIAIIANVAVFVTSIMEICVVEWNIVSVAPGVETLMASTQGLIRWVVLFIFKKEIYELFLETKIFWRIIDEDPNQETEAESVLQWLWKGMRFYLMCLCAAASTAFTLAIILTWGEDLPFVAWFPRDVRYGYLIFYLVQAVSITALLGLMMGGDGLFVVFCGLLIAQFKLLSRRLENSTNIESHSSYIINLQESINYHLKLLGFGEKIAKVFSALFLVQYLITVIASCIELFLLSEKMNDLIQFFIFITYMSTLMSEMAIFCFLSEAVMDESMNVSWAIYSSEWYSRNIKEVGVFVSMISTRAAKPITFTGCVLFVMGRILWSDIFKLSVSICTLLTSLK